jgi:hypothetical protein
VIADPIQWIVGSAQSDVLYRWATLLIGQAVLFGVAYLGYKGITNKVDGVKDQATLAATLAEPTGNGFAKDMRDSMKFLSEAIIRVETKVDTHIQDHARSSFKDKE